MGGLSDYLSFSKAAVSQNLQILRKAGLVKGEKRGCWTRYGIDKDVIHRIAEALMQTADQTPALREACLRTIEKGSKTDDLGTRTLPMCQNCCQQPTQLEDEPGNCTPEQIKKCHGDENDHPCAPKREKK